MSGKTLTSWNCHRLMLQPTLAAALLLVISPMYLTVAQHHRHDSWRGNYVEPDFVSQMASAIREAIESLIGQEAFRTLNENLSSLIWIVSCGISSALFVVARIVGQFLSSFGMSGDHATQFLKLKPEDVQVLLLWGLAAFIGYWVLSLLLRLVLTILSRIMWGLKVIIFGTCFIYIATVVPDRTMQTWLLLALLMIYVLLGWLSGSYSSGAQLEAKVRTLELQLEELQYRQRRSPKHKADE